MSAPSLRVKASLTSAESADFFDPAFTSVLQGEVDRAIGQSSQFVGVDLVPELFKSLMGGQDSFISLFAAFKEGGIPIKYVPDISIDADANAWLDLKIADGLPGTESGPHITPFFPMLRANGFGVLIPDFLKPVMDTDDIRGVELDNQGKLRLRFSWSPDWLLDTLPDWMNPLEVTGRAIDAIPLSDSLKEKYFKDNTIKPLPAKEFLSDLLRHLNDQKSLPPEGGEGLDLSRLSLAGVGVKLSMGAGGYADTKRSLGSRVDIPILAGAEIYLNGPVLAEALAAGNLGQLNPNDLLVNSSHIDWPDFDLSRLPLPEKFPFQPEGKVDLHWRYDANRRVHRLELKNCRILLRVPRILGGHEPIEINGNMTAELNEGGQVELNLNRLRLKIPLPRANQRIAADLAANFSGKIRLNLKGSGQKPLLETAQVSADFDLKTREAPVIPFSRKPALLKAGLNGAVAVDYDASRPKGALQINWDAQGSGDFNDKNGSLQAQNLTFRGKQVFDRVQEDWIPDFSKSDLSFTADLQGKQQGREFAAKNLQIKISPDAKHRWLRLRPGEGLLTVQADEIKAAGKIFHPELALALQAAPNWKLSGHGEAGVWSANPDMELAASLKFNTDFKKLRSWSVDLGRERYGEIVADGGLTVDGQGLGFEVKTKKPYSVRQGPDELVRDFSIKTEGRIKGKGVLIRKGSLLDAIVDLPRIIPALGSHTPDSARHFQVHTASLRDLHLTLPDLKAGPQELIRREIIVAELASSEPVPETEAVPDAFTPPSEPLLESTLEREIQLEIPAPEKSRLHTPVAKMLHDWFNRLEGFEMEANVAVPLTSPDTGQRVMGKARMVIKDLGIIDQAGVTMQPGYGYPLASWDKIPIFRVLEVQMNPEDRELETKISIFCIPIPCFIGIHGPVMSQMPFKEATLKGKDYDLRKAIPITLAQLAELVEKSIQELEEKEKEEKEKNEKLGLKTDEEAPEKSGGPMPKFDLEGAQLRVTGDFTNKTLLFGDASLGKAAVRFKKLAQGQHRIEVGGSLLNPEVKITGIQEILAKHAKGTITLVNDPEKPSGDLAVQIRMGLEDKKIKLHGFTVEQFKADNLMLEAVHEGQAAQFQMARGFEVKNIEFKWDLENPQISIGRFESKKAIFKGFGTHLETEDAEPSVMTGIQMGLKGGKPFFSGNVSGGLKGQVNYFPDQEYLGHLNFAFIRGKGFVNIRPDPEKGGEMLVELSGDLETLQDLTLLVRNEKMAGSVWTKMHDAKILAEGNLKIWPKDASMELVVKDPARPATVKASSGQVEVKQDTFLAELWKEEIQKLFGKLAPYMKTRVGIELVEQKTEEGEPRPAIEFSATELKMHSYVRPNNGKPGLEITSAKMGDVRIHGNLLGEVYGRVDEGVYIRGEFGKRTIDPDGQVHTVRMPVTLTLKGLEDGQENGRRVVRFKGIGLSGREESPTLTQLESEWCGFKGQLLSGAVDDFNFSPDDDKYEFQINPVFEAALRAGNLACIKIEAVKPPQDSP